MNASTIEMNRWDARRRIREYSEAIKRNPQDDFCRTALKTFRALARGKRVVDVAAAIGRAGVDAKGFPKLALARANWAEVWCKGSQWTEEGAVRRTLYFSRDRFPQMRQSRWSVDGASGSRLELPADLVGTLNQSLRARARVPIIPAGLRPAATSLAHYSILFEAEWDFTEPADPFLLRYLGGTLYVVLAAWDLTPAETAIFAGARQ